MTTERTEVLVISSGSYSDYRVHAVIDGTRDEAEALAQRAGLGHYDEYRIETLPVVKPDVQRVSVLLLTATVWDQDALVTDQHERTETTWPFDSVWDVVDVSWRWVRAPMHQGKGGRLDVHGTDHERVRKVFSDRLAMFRTDDAMRAVGEMTGGAR